MIPSGVSYESLPRAEIVVTGNTVVDAVRHIAETEIPAGQCRADRLRIRIAARRSHLSPDANPYSDGKAAARVCEAIENLLTGPS